MACCGSWWACWCSNSFGISSNPAHPPSRTKSPKRCNSPWLSGAGPIAGGGLGQTDLDSADLDAARVVVDATAQGVGQQLMAEADAKHRDLLLHRAVLIGQRLAVHERQVEKGSARIVHRLIPALTDRMIRHRPRTGLTGEGLGRAAKHVQRQLIEHDHQRQRPLGCLGPNVQPARLGVLPHRAKPVADLRIKVRRGPEPERPHGLGEPEVQHLGGMYRG